MVDHPRDELRGERAQPVRAAVVAERVVPVLRRERQVHVEARPALVGERPAHERREQPLAGGDLLHGRLQHEGPVCGVDRGRVLHVDLVLRVHELVVGGEGVEPELVAPEQHPQHDLPRVGDRADRVDARELVDVAAQAAVRLRVTLDEEELELGPDDRVSPRSAYAVVDALQQAARADGPRLRAVERPRVAEAPRHLRLPRNRSHRVEVRAHGEVDVALLPADDRRVAQVGAHHGGAERDAFVAEVGEVTERDVLAARDAVQVAVEQAHRAHALLREVAHDRLGVVAVLRHALSSSLTRARAPVVA